MSNRYSSDGTKDLAKKIKWMIVIRLLIVSSVLGIGSLIFRTAKIPFYFIIASYYFCSLVLIYFYRFRLRLPYLRILAYVHILLDVVTLTFVIHYTRGIESLFSFFYIVIIIAAGAVVSAQSAIITSIICCLFFLGVIGVEFFNIIPPLESVKAIYNDNWAVVYFAHIRVTIFILIGLLSGSILKKLEKKEEEVTDLQVFYGNILKSIPSGIIAFNLQGVITYANDSVRNFLGKERKEIIGVNILDLFCEYEKIKINLESVLKNQFKIIKNKEALINKSTRKKKVPIEYNVSLIINRRQTIIGKMMVLEDLTETKKMQEKVRRSDRLSAIGELAAGIAHEIRNPLASVSGSIEVLNENLKLKGNMKKLLQNILNESGRLNKIISEFLAFTREKTLESEKFKILPVIKDIMAMLKQRPDVKGKVKITFVNNAPAGISILGSVDQLKQVFYNIGINAVDAIGNKGDLKIVMDCVKKNKKKFVRIVFKDTGKGISKEDRAKIFQPFFTTKSKGSGIGLAIVYKIIKDHNGDIEVESEVGRGTKFILYLLT